VCRCGRELCGKCGNWHGTTGVCADCHEKRLKDDTGGSTGHRSRV
jgi:hypothetical protein